MKKIVPLFLLLLALGVRLHADATVLGPVTLTAQGATLTAATVYPESFVLHIALTGTAGVQVEGSIDGNSWQAIYMGKAGSQTISLTGTATGTYTGDAGSFKHLRAKIHYISSGVVRAVLSAGKGRASNFGVFPAATPVP